IQLNTTLPVIAAMKDTLAASPVTLVFDHFGNAKEELGAGQHGFSDLVSLVKSGKAYVKISVTAGPHERPISLQNAVQCDSIIALYARSEEVCNRFRGKGDGPEGSAGRSVRL